MVREFSQTVAEQDAQPCLHAENCHNLVPGMSQYRESQEFSEIGTVVEAKLPQPMDWDQESTTSNRDFSPARK